MRKAVLMIVGIILLVAGVFWTLQGLNLMGGSGGMNGDKTWAVIGPIVGIVGLIVLAMGARARRPRVRP